MSMIRRALGGVAIGAVALSGLLGVTAGPAHAGCDDTPPLPDGVIRRAGGQFKGQGLACMLEPTVTVNRKRSAKTTAVYEARFKNLETDSRDILVYNSSGPDAQYYKATVFKGSKDLTDKIVGQYPEGKAFKDIAPGEYTPTLTIKIKVRGAAPIDDVDYLHLLGHYDGDPVGGHFDGVVAQVTVVA